LKGHTVCVPIDINDTVTKLPRLPSEDGTVQVQLMRRITDKHPHKYDNVRPFKVKTAVEYLVNTEIYKAHNITLRENWENEWKRDLEKALSQKISTYDAEDEIKLLDNWDEEQTEEERAI